MTRTLPEAIRAVNARRQAATAERDVRLAAVLLGVPLPPNMRAVVEARAGNPGASWGEVAGTIGVSKDAAVSLWRRALKRRPA